MAITFKYEGGKKFLVSGFTESQIARINEICTGYPGIARGDAMVFNGNKKMMEQVEQFITVQAAIVATPVVDAAPTQTKRRVLVPSNFSDAEIINLVGNVTLSGRGATFTISADHPATHGDHLLGYEGCTGQYAYYL